MNIAAQVHTHKSDQKMKKETLAEIITIGDELLYGQVIDTNSAWMGEELAKIGIKVKQITSISDSPTAIREALAAAMSRADVVLVTGGLGPTKDDLTKHTLAEFFQTELQLHQPSLEDVEAIFKRYNRPMLEVNRQQAFLPANCTPVRNVLGTAPGMLFEEQGTVIVSMPGVPFEMKRMMTDTVLPHLQQHFQLPQIIHKVVQTVGLGESFLAERIADWENNLPANLKLAYLPHLAGVRLRLTGLPNGTDNLEEQMQAQIDQLAPLIADHVSPLAKLPWKPPWVPCSKPATSPSLPLRAAPAGWWRTNSPAYPAAQPILPAAWWPTAMK